MQPHDPRRFVEELRSHLAAPDRRLLFLFGAGTSCSVNTAPLPAPGERPEHVPLIPGIEGLTAICNDQVVAMGALQQEAWAEICRQCETAGVRPDVEGVLSRLRLKIDALSPGESLLGLDREQLTAMEVTICSTIATSVSPASDGFPAATPHDAFASWVRRMNRAAPIEIFTTNYDILFERAFEAARVPVFDGFVGVDKPFFYAECLDEDDLLPSAKWARLWKVHGSINWRLQGNRVVRGLERGTGEMILPSHRKYDESRKQPYMSYLDRLGRLLSAEHSLLVSCGYRFGDDHINAVVLGALDRRSTANLVILSFLDLDESDYMVRQACERSNLCIAGPNGAVIAGRWGEWRLVQPVDSKTWKFMDSAFDSNASMDSAEGSGGMNADDLSGRFRLGDFNWFCRFLETLRGAA